MNIQEQLGKAKKWLKKHDENRRHKLALKDMKHRYKNELAAHKISEDYLVQLITDYPGEDSKKAKLRNDLAQTQQTINNLELLLNYLEHAK